MIYRLAARLLPAVSVYTTTLFAGTIRIPADQPTIQAGITAAQNGDTVLVSPGTYVENIDFLGKAITVTSSGGSKATVIDGGGVYSVVTFSSGESASSILSGFTIQNGDANDTPDGEGGGIAIENSSPTIMKNVIQNNRGANAGGGIGIGFGSPLIKGNIIRSNSQAPAVEGGVGGGGISVRGSGSAEIIGNLIENNSWNHQGSGFGGGISLDGSGNTLIENNVIQGNVAGTSGAAIAMANAVSGVVIVQNLMVGNSSPEDAGIFWWNSPGALINNTITDGPAATGNSTSLIVTESLSSTLVVANNLIVSYKVATNAFYCDFGTFPDPANFYHNDVFSHEGAAYGGTCGNQTGKNGNLSKNPIFVSSNNFALKGGSAGIDAGSNKAPDLPRKDLAGNPRIINGKDGSTTTIDVGAYEFVPVTVKPASLNFGAQAVDSSTPKTVQLSNAQNRALSAPAFSVPSGYSVAGCRAKLAPFASCQLTVTFSPQSTGTFKGVITIRDNAGNSPQTLSVMGSAP